MQSNRSHSTRPVSPSVLALLLLGSLTATGLIAALPMNGAELTQPKATDRQVSLVVSSLMRRQHLSKHLLDDEISRRGLKNFLKTLDSMKLYFLQSDIAEFNESREELDDMIKRGDLTFSYVVFNRFLKRVDERIAAVDKLLQQPFDFDADEEIIRDPDTTVYAATPEEATDRWRRRIKYELLVLKADRLEDQKKQKEEGDDGEKPKKPVVDEETAQKEDRERLSRRYNSFAKRMHQTDSDELLEMYLTAVTTSFDPHTTYMSPSSLENFNIQMKLNLEGIGAALQLEDGYTKITKIIPGGAADKAGQLKPEDRIVSVGQDEEGEMVDVVDMKLGDVVKLIRGPAGTVVRLGVIPDGSPDKKIYKITRAKVELKDSEARGVIFEAGAKEDGMPYKIGMIDLPSFYMDMAGARAGLANYKSTTADVRKILSDFTDKGVDAVVLDLRRNGGGSLTEAINLTGLFIDRGPVVQVKDSDGRVQHYDDLDRGMSWSGPLVVLTSKFSASASEILAGAIQDYRRGLVVGDEATHGKGTVQSLLDLGSQLFKIPNAPNLGALKITMQQFYRPNGDSTQKRGVLADIVLPSITNHMPVGESDLDYAIEFDNVPQARYEKMNLANGAIISQIRAHSEARRQGIEDFAKLDRNIARYRMQKDRKTVSVNEGAFFAERAELDADREEEKQLEEETDEKEIIKRTYYVDEVLAITADYLNALRHNKLVGSE